MTPLEIARTLIALALALVPHESLARLLSEEEKKRLDAIADTAQAVKFPG